MEATGGGGVSKNWKIELVQYEYYPSGYGGYRIHFWCQYNLKL